jgi:hypothetical protein
MLKFRFGVANPFKFKEFRNIWNRSWTVTENKTLELQFYRYAYEVFNCDLDLVWKGSDHAGPNFELNILGWNVRLGLIDNRHWDYNRDTWEEL